MVLSCILIPFWPTVFWRKQSINQKTDQDASVLFHYCSGLSERHSFPLAFVSYGQWNEWGSQAIGLSTERGLARHMTPSETTGMGLAAGSRCGTTRTTSRQREA
jgi:hypothetical protein